MQTPLGVTLLYITGRPYVKKKGNESQSPSLPFFKNAKVLLQDGFG